MKFKNIVIYFSVTLIGLSLLVFTYFSINEYKNDKYISEVELSLQENDILSQKIKAKMMNGQLSSDDISTLFFKKSFRNTMLLKNDGQVIYNPFSSEVKRIDQLFFEKDITNINNFPNSTYVFEAKTRLGSNQLVVMSHIDDSEYFILTMSDKTILSRISFKIILNNAHIFIMLFIVAFLASLFATNFFKKLIDQIQHQLTLMSEAQFDFKVTKTSIVEFNSIHQSLLLTSNKLKKLLEEEKEKNRLQYEAQSAQVIQQVLIMPDQAIFNEMNLAAYYKPAGECSGDGYFYFVKGDELFITIIDVTGHGIASALLTGSVRSAFHFYSQMDKTTTVEICSSLNQLVCDLVKGKLQLTCFCLSINLKTKKGQYTNASHEAAIIIPSNIAEIKKPNQLNFLDDMHGARIGENSLSQYTSTEFTLSSNEKIFFYTDGLVSLENDKGEVMSERDVMKLIIAAFKSSSSNADIKAQISNQIDKYIKHTPLVDDVSFVILSE